jgi:hypothetical protein
LPAKGGSRISIMTKRPYVKRGRLAEVLALIQVLAFDPHTHRSEAHVIDKEIGTPCSAKGWIELAKEHPEMFRVSEEDKHPLSLIARHVQPVIPGDPDKKRQQLTPEFTQTLIKTAIDLHDRQAEEANRWKHLMPLWVALLAGGLTIFSSIATLRWGHPVTSGRFVHAGDPYPDAILLDTASGRYCSGDIAGQKNPSNIPSCKDLR